MATVHTNFGTVGVWLSRAVPREEIVEVANAAESLGYGAVWVAGGRDRGIFELVRLLLEATERIPVGTSILNMYAETPAEATVEFDAIEADFPGRFVLGVGPSHAPLIESRMPGAYLPPLAKSRQYLDGLDAEIVPVPRDRRVLSALGPLALKLSAERTLGTIPYASPVAHTRAARAIIGPDALLAPELGVVLTDDVVAARARAREFLASYLVLPNYTSMFLRHGYDDIDLEDGGSDRLLDGLFAFGLSSIRARIDEHLAAGADHVAVQALPLPDQTRVGVLDAIASELGLTGK